MSAHWDFRKILAVDPDNDRLCVGYEYSEGRRCHNPVNVGDRLAASRLLNSMNRSPNIYASIEDLGELAALLLCNHVHNNKKSRAYLSQVDEVYNKWSAIVEKQYVVAKKQNDEAAMLRVQRELSKMKENAQQMKVKLEEERATVVVSKSFKTKEPASVTRAPFVATPTMEDPFFTNEKLVPTKPNLFKNMPSASVTVEEIKLPVPDNGSEVLRASARGAMQKLPKPVTSILVPQEVHLPSPPTTPILLEEPEHKKIKQEDPPTPSPTKAMQPTTTGQHAITKTSSITLSSRTNFAFEFGAKSTTTQGIFNFNLPSKDDMSAKIPEQQAMLEMGNQTSVSVFKFGTQDDVPPKDFEFDIPRKSSRRTKPIEKDLKKVSTVEEQNVKVKSRQSYSDSHILMSTSRSAAIEQPEEEQSPQSTPAKTEPPSTPQNADTAPFNHADTQEQPTTPLKKPPPLPQQDSAISISTINPQPEQSFGYAVITPTSTRYSTYLPTRQQHHNLLTPPETPESPLQTRSQPQRKPSPVREVDYFAAFPDPPSLTIMRKPLPIPPTQEVENGNMVQNVPLCEDCGSESGVCKCPNDCGEEAVHTGCWGLRRLGRKVRGKVREVKLKVEAKLHRDQRNGVRKEPIDRLWC